MGVVFTRRRNSRYEISTFRWHYVYEAGTILLAGTGLCPIRDPLSGTGCQEICQARLTDFMTRQSRIGKVYRLAGYVAGGTEAMPERAIADNLVLHFVVC